MGSALACVRSLAASPRHEMHEEPHGIEAEAEQQAPARSGEQARGHAMKLEVIPGRGAEAHGLQVRLGNEAVSNLAAGGRDGSVGLEAEVVRILLEGCDGFGLADLVGWLECVGVFGWVIA